MTERSEKSPRCSPWGAGASSGAASYPSRLEALLGARFPTIAIRVLNRGVDGERSDHIRARFQRDVVDAPADAVVIIAGVNDVYQGRSAESVERELEAMYDAARAARIVVVAGSIIPFNSTSPDQNARMHAVNDWIRAYAVSHARSMVFCDTRAAVAAPGDPDRLVSSPDDLHPSPDGYKRMAAALEPAIKQALGQSK